MRTLLREGWLFGRLKMGRKEVSIYRSNQSSSSGLPLLEQPLFEEKKRRPSQSCDLYAIQKLRTVRIRLLLSRSGMDCVSLFLFSSLAADGAAKRRLTPLPAKLLVETIDSVSLLRLVLEVRKGDPHDVLVNELLLVAVVVAGVDQGDVVGELAVDAETVTGKRTSRRSSQARCKR
jgi:hypothetical protein